MMGDLTPESAAPFFTIAAILPSSSDDVITILHRAYRTVFSRNFVPARDHLLLWMKTCSALGVNDSVVEELREILPRLPDLTWKNVARVVGLDPSLGNEQLSEKPIQTLFLPVTLVNSLLGTAQRSSRYRRDRQGYVHLGSTAVKSILLDLLRGFVYDNEGEDLDASYFDFELRIVGNAVLLVVEAKRSASSEVHAQALAEATCLAASNSRSGYSLPIHVVITDREETTFYTYDRKQPPPIPSRLSHISFPASAKQFYLRSDLKIEYFQRESVLGESPERLREWQLLRMTCILGRDLFSLIIEGYCDFIQATIRPFELPLALQPLDVTTEKLSVYDEHSFMRRFRTTVQSTGTNAEQVMVVCHVLFSFIGFEIRGERFDVDDKSQTISYHISNFPDLEFELRVEAVHRTEPDSPSMMVTLQWRRPNENWQLSVSIVSTSSISLTSDLGFLVILLRELFPHRCSAPFKF
ncbi:uncharacterized protein EV420DRAFT_1139860 [Desarmillaria tabescens]|uniref:Uncharacterized protein n=1 Tax=Armillaria tabescens TaxID=1929756 RepID=A0AA39TQC3_ARMTA|nr:uncharacterized protein EV420DRAFT_1139860 [Desarmillaria tabescens]KAK0462823.1 hypothetical protein EV420DRAFT_1139860 [Desarmillaria tabescens]